MNGEWTSGVLPEVGRRVERQNFRTVFGEYVLTKYSRIGTVKKAADMYAGFRVIVTPDDYDAHYTGYYLTTKYDTWRYVDLPDKADKDGWIDTSLPPIGAYVEVKNPSQEKWRFGEIIDNSCNKPGKIVVIHSECSAPGEGSFIEIGDSWRYADKTKERSNMPGNQTIYDTTNGDPLPLLRQEIEYQTNYGFWYRGVVEQIHARYVLVKMPDGWARCLGSALLCHKWRPISDTAPVVSYPHNQGEQMFDASTSIAKDGSRGLIIQRSNNKVIWESDVQTDTVDEETGKVTESADDKARKLAQSVIDNTSESLFANVKSDGTSTKK